jgi:DNA-binding XRE family transcriptional regulator
MGVYDAVTRSRADALQQFQHELRMADIKTDVEFQRVFLEARALLDMSDQEIADAVSASRPTVNRWANGKNLPYLAVRRAVISWIDKQLSLTIRRLNAAARRFAAAASSSSSNYEPVAIAAKSR